MNTQLEKKNHIFYVPESAELTEFPFEPANVQSLELIA